MRRPIVFRPHANIAHFVFSLVIEAERLESGLRRTFVEPASRKHAASSLYSHHRSAGTLVLDHIDFKAGVLKMILVGLVDRAVMSVTIVRQDEQRLLVFPFA